MAKLCVFKYQLAPNEYFVAVDEGLALMLIALVEDNAGHLLDLVQLHIAHTQSRLIVSFCQIYEQCVFGHLRLRAIIIRSVPMVGELAVPRVEPVTSEDIIHKLER